MDFLTQDEHYMLPVYKRYPLLFTRGEGASLWDDSGKRYLDFYAGHAVCSMGHAYEPVLRAITDQARKLLFYSNVAHTKPALELAACLARTLAPDKYLSYFANSGSEANETALKIVRKATGKPRVVAFRKSFHGRTIADIGITGIDDYHRFEPNLDSFTNWAELGDMESVRRACCNGEEIAAIICEPIQSIGGVRMAEPEFYIALEAFCKDSGIYLIFDEVQTGCGRCGHYWFARKCGVSPDIITTAKGIAAGLALSAVLVKDSLAAKVEIGDHAATFGGGPVVCKAALAVFETLAEPGFFERLNANSVVMMETISRLKGVECVRGEGYLLGVVFKKPLPGLTEKCLEAGLIIGGSSDENVVRITPPLNISDDNVTEFLRIFSEVLSTYYG